MPRSSRSKSHKQHKHSSKDARDYTDSEEEESLKERKAREEPAVVSGIRVSNDVESGEKKKVRDLLIPGSSGYSEEHGSTRRRKDRADSSIGSGRLNGREEERLEGLVGESTTKSENFMHDAEKIPRSKGPTDSKNKSSRRHESGSERRDENLVFSVDNEESKRVTGKVDLKRKLEKGSSRKESHQYKDLKEKERGAEKEKKVRDGRRPSSVDIVDITNGGSEGNRKQGALKGEDEHHAKKEVENTEWPLQDVLHKPDFEKEHEKIRPGDAYGDKNGREEGKHLSSREGGQRNKSYKVETHEDDIYKDKHHKFLEKDLKHNSEKHRDERFSRHHSTDKYENKHFREDNKSSESHNKKVKLQDNDHDGSPREDYRSVRYRDNGGRRVSPDDEDRTEIKSRGTKEQSTDGGKTALSSSKQGSSLDRRSPESHSRHLNAVNSAASSNRQLKSSPGSSVHVEEVHRRHASKPVESIYGDSLSEERLRHSSTRDFPDRVSESQSRERLKRKADSHSGESQVENTVNSKFELTEERRFSNRTGEDRVQEFPFQKLAPGDFSQVEPLHREPTPSSSSFSRMGPTSANSPTLHLPPFRHEVENPSVMVSEDDSRGQGGDLKPKNRSYRRFGDTSSIGRGRGNSAWKGIPNWSVPLANGFIPFQHGQPPTGFHPVLQQFSAPMFGVGPSMEMNHAGVSWHDPGHPFGWQNHADDSCPPHLHGWDRNNGGFGDDSRTYARSDWDPSRHLSSQGPGTCTDIWKGQNGNNMEFPAHKEQDYSGQVASDEIWDGGSFQRACNERNRPIRLPAESIEIKRSCSSPSAKTTATEAPLPPPSVVQEKMPELSKSSKLDDAVDFCHVYLSKLDISLDLAGPELYNQCMNLTGTERDTAVVSTGTYDKYTEEGTIPGTKSSNYGLWSLLFPASSDIVSQRSMALYRKQQEKMKAKIPISPAPGPGLEKLSTAFDEEVARPTMDRSEQHVVKAASSSSYEQITVALVDPSGKINEQKFDTVSSGVVISGSQACETLMPESIECRLSLSRIHNSPENTH